VSACAGSAARVCVVGNAAIDLTMRVERLPLPGETALAVSTMEDFGGKGANQAVAAQRAGARVVLFCALGDDADGERILAQVRAEQIDTCHIARLPCRTDLSIITVDARGENTIVTRNEAASRYAPDHCALLDATDAGDWVVLQGNLGEAVTTTILREMRGAARRTLFNPGPVRFDCIPALDVVDVAVVNAVEASTLTGLADPVAAAQALLRAGAREVLVTLGAHGVLQCSAAGIQSLAAHRTHAVDTVGAGDVFCGTLVAALARHIAMAQAVSHAQAAAAVAVARHGAQASFPGRAELRALFAFPN
jgi:ribokinase